jgi:HlyD family secretion protein
MRWTARSLIKERRALGVAALLLAASLGLFAYVRSTRREPNLPAYQVQRSEFLDVLQFRGDLKALKSVTISAPPDVGMLQILKIAQDGSQVKKGDVVVEFDPSKTKQELDQDKSILKSADAQIEQARAQGKLTDEEDTTAVMKARFDVESAKLDASKSEIVSRIEGAESQLKVTDAEQSLRQAEEKLKADRAKTAATVDAYRHASGKAKFDEERASHGLDSMILKAPADGTISLVPVWHSGSEGPFKAGDQVWSGAPIAELPDASSLRIIAHVDETERGRLVLTGKIVSIGTIASMDFSAGWPFPRNFSLDVAIDQSDARLRPGMTVQITVIIDRIPNSISIPTQASFVKSGRTVAYVWNGSKFDERTIQIERRSRDRALISSGLAPGDRVALKDPTVAR